MAALAPAAVVAALTLYLVTQTEAILPEADRASGETLRFYTIGIGRLKTPIHPRGWAAVFVLLGTVLWCVGILFLLFVRTS